MARRSTALATLRAQLAERHPQVLLGGAAGVEETLRRDRISTGVEALDALLGGGFPTRALCAWVGNSGVGWTSLLRAVVHHRLLVGGRVAIIDGARTLEARDWVALAQGRSGGRLLFVRPRERGQALWAFDELAASGAFDLVVLDQPPPQLQRGSSGLQHRLRRAAGEGHSALLVIGSGASSLGAPLVLRGSRPVGALERGRQILSMRRIRGGAPCDAEVIFDVEEQLFACRLSVDSPIPDRRRAWGSGRS